MAVKRRAPKLPPVPVPAAAPSARGDDRSGVSGRSLSRHLEGWQPGALAVFLAVAGALIVVPRAVEPVELPEPTVDTRALARMEELDRERAASVERHPLDADVRALGSAMRAYGRADASGEADEVQAARDQVVTAFRRALPVAPDDVLRLRAVQLAQFAAAVRQWETTGFESEELGELGGAFLQALRKSGWVEEEPGRRRVDLDGAALATLFKRRWNEVTGAVGPGFDLSLDEQRSFYRFLLHHPVLPSLLPLSATPSPAELDERRAVARAQTQQYRLKKVEELARIDPGFAAELARGVVEYQRGRYALASEHFRRHLEAAPDGPYTLRARNYLRAALDAARTE